MVAEKILGNIQDKPQKKAIIPVAFEWFELEKKRIKKTAEDGTEFGISIPEVLKEGDILGETESALYVVPSSSAASAASRAPKRPATVSGWMAERTMWSLSMTRTARVRRP